MLRLRDIPVNPVGDVQGTVDTQGKEVVSRNRLGLAGALQHEQLRQDGDALEPNRKGPHNLPEVVLVGQQDGENRRESQKVLHPEGVEPRVVGRLVGADHQVDDVSGGGDEEDLEDEVVVACCPEEICMKGERYGCQRNGLLW